jgi:precorrin-6A/cobalt-precorrin-6A reductase
VWLIAGTGEGPVLTEALLARGWRLRLSVVGQGASRAYRTDPNLELAVGPIGEGVGLTPERGVERELAAAELAGDPYAWVVDASHPFATTISAALARVCHARHQPVLRLGRPVEALQQAVLLDDLPQLEACVARGERLLLAIGARQLPLAVRHSPGAIHHARLLPDPTALRIVMAAGLHPGRVACLRPGVEGRIERNEEVQLLMKTTPECLPALETAVRELHSYEIPEWIHWQASAGAPYGPWCAGEVAALSPDAAPSAPAVTPGDGGQAG